MEYEVEGARPRGRPKKTWREIVEKDCKACGLNREDAMDRSRWRKQIGMIDDHDECEWVNVSSGTGSPALSRITGAKDSEWQWYQLGRMQICTLLQTDNHTSTPSLSFLQAGCPSCHPTNSVKALKAKLMLMLAYSCVACFCCVGFSLQY